MFVSDRKEAVRVRYRRPFWSLALIALLSLYVPSCGRETSLSSTAPEPPGTLSEAVARWHSWKIHDYAFTQTRRCWYPWCGDSVRVVVRADTICFIVPLSRTVLDTARGLTVDRLFEIAQSDTSRWTVQAEFDQTYGFPRSLSYQIKPPPITEGGMAYITFDFVH